MAQLKSAQPGIKCVSWGVPGPVHSFPLCFCTPVSRTRESPRKRWVPRHHFIAGLCHRGVWECWGRADKVRSETRCRWERLVARWKQERQHDELPLISVWLRPPGFLPHRPYWHLPADSSALTFPYATHTHTLTPAHAHMQTCPQAGSAASTLMHSSPRLHTSCFSFPDDFPSRTPPSVLSSRWLRPRVFFLDGSLKMWQETTEEDPLGNHSRFPDRHLLPQALF